MIGIIAPLVGLVIAIGLGAAVGDAIARKTGRKAIGWPVGILVFFLLMAVSGWVSSVLAAERDRQARTAFQKQHPCPTTGKSGGACPGYVVDHIRPLCAGGVDAPVNMQWQTVAAAKEKDRAERAMCTKRK